MPLTDAACRGARADSKPKKIGDAGGLYLLVKPNGSRLWQMAYRYQGKQKTLSFGPYPATGLADARGLRDRAKRALADGFDPATHKYIEKTDHDTFESVGREWLDAQATVWAPKYAPQVIRTFERDVFPMIGSRPIADIEATEILKVIRAVEARGAQDIAKRLRQKIGCIFRYGIATSRCKRDPAADLKGALKPPPKTRHMAALKAGDLPAFFQKLRAYDGEPQTALALELIMHVVVRTSELRFGKWDEIDGDLWRIPAERMKRSNDHLVPLTKQAQAILAKLQTLAGDSEWIVPGVRGKPISENTLLFSLYRMGYHSRATTHGFRSTFSTIANESGQWSADAIERQLAHVPGDAVRASYNRAQYLDERRRLLTWWSDYLDAAEAKGRTTDLSDLLT